MDYLPDYAQLHAISNYTFLRGASYPAELVTQADELGYRAIAITDECSVSGIVRAHIEAKKRNIKLIIGSEFVLQQGMRVVLLATNRTGYGRLTHIITVARKNSDKGQYRLNQSDLQTLDPQNLLALWFANEYSTLQQGQWLYQLFPQSVWIALSLEQRGNDAHKINRIKALSQDCNIPCVACTYITLHHAQRRPLRDVLTAIRHKTSVSDLGFKLQANAEQRLRSRKKLAHYYPADMLAASIEIAARCNFCMDELRYEYPLSTVPKGYNEQQWLAHLAYQGAEKRWPQGVPVKVQNLLKHELELIHSLHYSPYFLTVNDIVQYARRQGILCQGRGSAANSAVCYCLGITEVDPDAIDLLFERFISRERDEPPDIDVDFEHERREEVIQYIYKKYGRNKAALAATVITYKPKSAIRDVGKALGLSLHQVDRIAKSISHWDEADLLDQRLKECGFDPRNRRIRQMMKLVEQLLGFPRHLSQHVGGFVISRGALSELVPIENAAMPERTVIQWEKDDLEALGLLKIDILALGMLSAIRKSFEYIEGYSGKRWSMASLPKEDKQVYNMIQQADTIGVFQIESRAQMSMLPRLRPASYYDLVIEVAIVRPGPIQGDMVHPYLKRRRNPASVSYPSKALEKVLKRTLGIPIFQEQVMQIAIIAAGFTAGEADQLRRSMASWKRRGGLEKFEHKLLDGMKSRGYEERFAQQVFNQIKGFGDYGFPESHAASFALLAYVSSWLKYYEPAAFCCGLLNSQPMGFYRPAQLVKDAIAHGVEVRPIDINQSYWDCHLQPARSKQPALRMGLRMVKGLSKTVAENIVDERRHARFRDMQDLVQRTAIDRKNLSAITAANALYGIAGHRHLAYWHAQGSYTSTPLIQKPSFNEAEPLLARPTRWQQTVADYASTGLTLEHHPMQLLREHLGGIGIISTQQLTQTGPIKTIKVAGLVLNRQRPMTASGVVFLTLEDEVGYANIVVWPKIAMTYRRILMLSNLMIVTGKVQTEDNVTHVIASSLADGSDWLRGLKTKSRNFH